MSYSSVKMDKCSTEFKIKCDRISPTSYSEWMKLFVVNSHLSFTELIDLCIEYQVSIEEKYDAIIEK